MAVADAKPDIPVPWDRLLLWVQEQISIEAQTGQRVPLTRPQLQAVSQLVSFNQEPDVSDQDYVSLLMNKTQTLRLTNASFADQEPTTIPIDGHFQPLWRCVCTVERYGAFPRQGFGYSAGQEAPFFQSKKNAKQFAAKHALCYLTLNRTTVSGTNVPAIIPPSISPLQLPKPQVQLPPLKRLKSNPPLKPPGPSCSVASSLPSPRSSSSSSVFEQIATLAHRMAFDSPTYKIEPDPAGGDLFCGRPVFKNGVRIPPELGIVSGIAGQNQAKLKVAESVLEWLQSELKKRQATFDSLWSAATSPQSTTTGVE